MKAGFLPILFFVSLKAFALEGLAPLEQQLAEKNQSLQALRHDIRSKESLLQSSHANFYPSLEAIGGWGEDRLEAPKDRDKGYFGYLNGRLNLFRGFKDSSLSSKNEMEVKLAQIEYEKARRELRQQLIEITSEMIYLHKLQNILASEEKVTEEHRKMAAKKVASGLTSSVDNLEFDLREQEIQIQRRQIDQLHRESHQKLVQLFGSDIPDPDLDRLNFDSPDRLATVPAYDHQHNLDVQKSEVLHQISEFEKKEIRSEFLPSLDFIYSVGRLTPTEETPVSMNEAKYALQISIPLFSGFDTAYKSKAASSNIQARKAQATQAGYNALSSYSILQQKTSELHDLYKINERRLETAKKYFDMTVGEYKRGIKNSPDLVGATERWFSSQKRQYELLKEMELTKVKIENLN